MLCQKRWDLTDGVSLHVKTATKRTKSSPESAMVLYSMEIELLEEPTEDTCLYLQEHYEFLETLGAKTVARLLREHQLFLNSCRLHPRIEAICFR